MIFTTFDPANVSLATLSSGNLVVTRSAAAGTDGGAFGVAADIKASGKYYFEINLSSAGASSDTSAGIAQLSATYAGLGNDALNGAVVFTSGNLWINGSNTGSVGAVTPTCEFAVDLDNHLIWARANGGNWNDSGTADPATATGGRTIQTASFVPVVVQNGSPATFFTANFGATSFVGTPPAGFTAGWPAVSTLQPTEDVMILG